MRKFLLLIISVLITIIVGTIILIKNKEYYITDNEYLYDIALNYLIEQDNNKNNPDLEKEKYHFFVTYDGLGITEKDNKKYVYMWVLGESYYLDNNGPKELSGYSIFHKFTFENDKIINVEIPKDGSYYFKSVKEMCPDKKMEKKVLNYNSNLDLKNQVSLYYSNSKIIVEEIKPSNYNYFDIYLERDGIIIYKRPNIKEIYFIEIDKKETLKDYISNTFQTTDDSIKHLTSLLDDMQTLKDGGTKIYKSKKYNITIVKCNTVEGNKDIFIGNYDMSFEATQMCRR